jgi:hypothetical protein
MPTNDQIPGLEGQGYAAGNTMAFQTPTPAPVAQPSLLDRVVNIFHRNAQPTNVHPVDTYLNRADQLESQLNALEQKSRGY